MLIKCWLNGIKQEKVLIERDFTSTKLSQTLGVFSWDYRGVLHVSCIGQVPQFVGEVDL